MNFSFRKTPYLKTAVFAWLSKAITIPCKLIIIALLVKNLNTSEYAALAVLASLEAWFLLLDFGLGASIQNHLSESFAQNEKGESFLKTALVLSLIAFVIGITLLIPIHSLCADFLLGKILPPPFSQFFLTSSFFFLLGTFGYVASRVLMAEQKGFIVYSTQGLGSLLSLGFLWIFQKELSLSFALFLTVGIPSLLSFALSWIVFSRIDWKVPIYWKVIKRAKGFWISSLITAFALSSDFLIAPRTLQSIEIVQYSLLVKLFGLPCFVYCALLQGLWPTCSEKWALNQGFWVIQKIRQCVWIGVTGAIFFTFTVLLFSSFIESFLGVFLPFNTIVFAGLYLIVKIVADFHAMGLHSRSDLTSFFYLVPIQALISLFFQWYLSLFFGIIGIFGGLILSYLLTVCWALPRRLSQVQKKIAS